MSISLIFVCTGSICSVMISDASRLLSAGTFRQTEQATSEYHICFLVMVQLFRNVVGKNKQNKKIKQKHLQ